MAILALLGCAMGAVDPAANDLNIRADSQSREGLRVGWIGPLDAQTISAETAHRLPAQLRAVDGSAGLGHGVHLVPCDPEQVDVEAGTALGTGGEPVQLPSDAIANRDSLKRGVFGQFCVASGVDGHSPTAAPTPSLPRDCFLWQDAQTVWFAIDANADLSIQPQERWAVGDSTTVLTRGSVTWIVAATRMDDAAAQLHLWSLPTSKTSHGILDDWSGPLPGQAIWFDVGVGRGENARWGPCDLARAVASAAQRDCDVVLLDGTRSQLMPTQLRRQLARLASVHQIPIWLASADGELPNGLITPDALNSDPDSRLTLEAWLERAAIPPRTDNAASPASTDSRDSRIRRANAWLDRQARHGRSIDAAHETVIRMDASWDPEEGRVAFASSDLTAFSRPLQLKSIRAFSRLSPVEWEQLPGALGKTSQLPDHQQSSVRTLWFRLDWQNAWKSAQRVTLRHSDSTGPPQPVRADQVQTWWFDNRGVLRATGLDQIDIRGPGWLRVERLDGQLTGGNRDRIWWLEHSADASVRLPSVNIESEPAKKDSLRRLPPLPQLQSLAADRVILTATGVTSDGSSVSLEWLLRWPAQNRLRLPAWWQAFRQDPQQQVLDLRRDLGDTPDAILSNTRNQVGHTPDDWIATRELLLATDQFETRKQNLPAVINLAGQVLERADAFLGGLPKPLDPETPIPNRLHPSDNPSSADVNVDPLHNRVYAWAVDAAYRRTRAIGYRELPEVLRDVPISDWDEQTREFEASFQQLSGLVNRSDPDLMNHPEFILTRVRRQRRLDQFERSLELLEIYGDRSPDPRWYFKKRGDLCQDLGRIDAARAARSQWFQRDQGFVQLPMLERLSTSPSAAEDQLR